MSCSLIKWTFVRRMHAELLSGDRSEERRGPKSAASFFCVNGWYHTDRWPLRSLRPLAFTPKGRLHRFLHQDKRRYKRQGNRKARCRAEDRGATFKPKTGPISIG
jgi:hypothetical protein